MSELQSGSEKKKSTADGFKSLYSHHFSQVNDLDSFVSKVNELYPVPDSYQEELSAKLDPVACEKKISCTGAAILSFLMIDRLYPNSHFPVFILDAQHSKAHTRVLALPIAVQKIPLEQIMSQFQNNSQNDLDFSGSFCLHYSLKRSMTLCDLSKLTPYKYYYDNLDHYIQSREKAFKLAAQVEM